MKIPRYYTQTYFVGKKPEEYIHVEEKPDYPNKAYCNNCKKRWPLDLIYCGFCNRKIRRKPVNVKGMEFKRY